MGYVDRKLWEACRLCGQDFSKCKPGKGRYKTQVFREHLLNEHSMLIDEYFVDIRPICSCGICGKRVEINKKPEGNFKLQKLACGRYPGLLEWSKNAKESRKGVGNPMFGKSAWNIGLSKETNEIVKKMSESMVGRAIGEEAKLKMSESAKKRTVHGHTGRFHSEESKQVMREKTIARIKRGDFKQTKTKPHIEFSNILKFMNIIYEEEFQLDCWSFDFYLPEYDILVEVDGDYFHSNPKTYPDGPKTKTQKINWYRDLKKNKYCEINGQKLARFWECDILNHKEEIICRLNELCQLKK